MDVAQDAVSAYKESVSTAEVYTADGNAYKGLPGESVTRDQFKLYFQRWNILSVKKEQWGWSITIQQSLIELPIKKW